MRPPAALEIPFDMLFPLLVFHYAQIHDNEIGGEWASDVNWGKICNAIDVQKRISVSYAQMDSLLYSYKMGVLDKRKPFLRIWHHETQNYLPLLEKFKRLYPDLLKQDKDGDIELVGKLPAADLAPNKKTEILTK